MCMITISATLLNILQTMNMPNTKVKVRLFLCLIKHHAMKVYLLLS